MTEGSHPKQLTSKQSRAGFLRTNPRPHYSVGRAKIWPQNPSCPQVRLSYGTLQRQGRQSVSTEGTQTSRFAGRRVGRGVPAEFEGQSLLTARK
jgi:hypothetical protein